MYIVLKQAKKGKIIFCFCQKQVYSHIPEHDTCWQLNLKSVSGQKIMHSETINNYNFFTAVYKWKKSVKKKNYICLLSIIQMHPFWNYKFTILKILVCTLEWVYYTLDANVRFWKSTIGRVVMCLKVGVGEDYLEYHG